MKQQFKVKLYDDVSVIGAVGDTVTSSDGDRIKICRFRPHYRVDPYGNNVDWLIIRTNGGREEVLENGRFYGGEWVRDFEVINGN